jgi:hypothetical protein
MMFRPYAISALAQWWRKAWNAAHGTPASSAVGFIGVQA